MKRSPITLVLAGVALLIAIAALGSSHVVRTVVSLAFAGAPPGLVVPVRGVQREALVDAWRDGPGVPRHRAIDIFCVRGTDVLAPVRGVVLSVGGHSLRLIGPGAQIHVFANVAPRPGLTPGQLVAAGEVLAQVDDPSGDERGLTPHLHYALFAFPGRAVDPYDALTAAGAQ